MGEQPTSHSEIWCFGITWPLNGSQPLNVMFTWRCFRICQLWKKKDGRVGLSERRRSLYYAPRAILVGFSKLNKAVCSLCLQRPSHSFRMMKCHCAPP